MTIPLRYPPSEDRCEAVLMVQTAPNFYTPIRCIGRSVADCNCTTDSGKRIIVSLCEEHARLIGVWQQAQSES